MRTVSLDIKGSAVEAFDEIKEIKRLDSDLEVLVRAVAVYHHLVSVVDDGAEILIRSPGMDHEVNHYLDLK